MFSKRQVFVFDSAKPSATSQSHSYVKSSGVWHIQAGSSILLIAPLRQADERWTTNENPSDETKVTYSVLLAIFTLISFEGVLKNLDVEG